MKYLFISHVINLKSYPVGFRVHIIYDVLFSL